MSIKNEGELAKDIQTMRDCTGHQSEACGKAINEVMDFMKQGGPLQDQLTKTNMIKLNGNTIDFNPAVYPNEKSEK